MPLSFSDISAPVAFGSVEVQFWCSHMQTTHAIGHVFFCRSTFHMSNAILGYKFAIVHVTAKTRLVSVSTSYSYHYCSQGKLSTSTCRYEFPERHVKPFIDLVMINVYIYIPISTHVI